MHQQTIIQQVLTAIVVSATIGCAAARPRGTGSTLGCREYADAPASALVFTPAVAAGQEPIDLWRDLRAPGAFVGFEDLSTTFIYLRTDDRQTNDGTDRYLRRVVIERVGYTYR